jgi:hypothetical protein
MKKLISLLVSLSLLFSSNTFALTYTETRPEAIRSLAQNGPGSIYAFLRPDGAIERNRVVSLTPSSDGKSVVVTLERADNKLIVNFSDENHFSYEPISSGESESTSNAGNSAIPAASDARTTGPVPSVDWAVGVSSGVMAGLQVGIIEASGFGAQIEAAYRHIEELHQKIGEEFLRIERARFDLENKVVAVSLKATRIKPQAKLLEVTLETPNRASIRELVDQNKNEAARINFISKNTQFLERAHGVQRVLVDAKIKDSIDQSFFNISKSALVIADQQSFLGRDDAAGMYLGIAETAADVLVGLDPFTGVARSLYESVSGTNMITGETLTPLERAISVAGVLTAGYALKSYTGFKILQKISLRVAPVASKGLEFAERLFFSTKRALSPRAAERIERSINTLSKVDKKWGFTQKHLNRHFLGDSQYSLKVIDPAGSAESWLNNIADLFQRPITRKLNNGAVDILGTFSKSDGIGTYDLGVRLWPNKDGTFELITILTKQLK